MFGKYTPGSRMTKRGVLRLMNMQTVVDNGMFIVSDASFWSLKRDVDDRNTFEVCEFR